MNTVDIKLQTLINTKQKINTAINQSGITVPADLPFSQYSELIRLIAEVPETTSTSDLLNICNFDLLFPLGKYEEKEYNEQNLTEFNQILNNIINGEE